MLKFKKYNYWAKSLNRPDGRGVRSVDCWQPRCAPSAVVILDTPCSEVVWRVLATHCISQFPTSVPHQCVAVCHHISTAVYVQINLMSLSLFDSWDVAELRTDLVAFFCSNQQYRPVEMWRHTRRKKISSFARNGPIHLNRPGGQGVSAGQPSCAPSAVIMLDTPCSEVVRRVLAIHCIRQFPPSLPLPCVTLCHHISTGV